MSKQTDKIKRLEAEKALLKKTRALKQTYDSIQIARLEGKLKIADGAITILQAYAPPDSNQRRVAAEALAIIHGEKPDDCPEHGKKEPSQAASSAEVVDAGARPDGIHVSDEPRDGDLMRSVAVPGWYLTYTKGLGHRKQAPLEMTEIVGWQEMVAALKEINNLQSYEFLPSARTLARKALGNLPTRVRIERSEG